MDKETKSLLTEFANIPKEFDDDNLQGIENSFETFYRKIWGHWFEIRKGPDENSLCYNLPDHLLYKVDKTFMQKVTNLEALRHIRERIGVDKYIKLFDAKIINRETDNQGNEMKLYEYDEKGTRVIMLEVLCPSTQRLYHLYPPNQECRTCFEAKKSTFGDKDLTYRHGDVGLINKDDKGDYTAPFSET